MTLSGCYASHIARLSLVNERGTFLPRRGGPRRHVTCWSSRAGRQSFRYSVSCGYRIRRARCLRRSCRGMRRGRCERRRNGGFSNNADSYRRMSCSRRNRMSRSRRDKTRGRDGKGKFRLVPFGANGSPNPRCRAAAPLLLRSDSGF